MGRMRRSGSSLLLLATLALAGCGGDAAAQPEAVVTSPVSTVAPTTPGTLATVPALPAATPATLAPTGIPVVVPTTLPPETTSAPIPATTLAPVETTVPPTVPPTTEPPLTLPLITLSTVPAPLPTLPAAPAPPQTLPTEVAIGGGGGGGGGGGIGRLEIPKLGINSGLLSGIDMPTLNRGPGHWPGTARPGQSGNVVVAGHRTSHGGIFRNINSLGAGDQIIFDTANGRFTYVVTGVQIVNPDAMWIVGQGGGARATLFACHPPGSTRQRIVVFATLAG